MKFHTCKFSAWCSDRSKEIKIQFQLKQESPAWTQETYRPRRIKYYHLLPEVGYPLTRSDGGGYPRWDTPHLHLAGVPPPIWTWLGYPHQTWLGYPPHLVLAWVPPPPRCRQTDRHVSKHNIPVVLRTRSVIKETWIYTPPPLTKNS